MLLLCAYYRNRHNGSIWALRVDALGRIRQAVGPLIPAATIDVPMAHHVSPPIDVAGWELQAFLQIGETWQLRAANRLADVLAPAHRVESHRDDRGFYVRLLPA